MMIAKIQIPVIDTESGKYEYRGKLSREEYSDMEYDEFRRTNSRVGYFVETMGNHDYSNRLYDINQDEHPDILYRYEEVEVYLQDSNQDSIEKDYLLEHFKNEDMFLLIMNINPVDMNNDAESELRFWLDGSERVHKDDTLDDRTKLLNLPMRFFFIEIDGRTYVLNNCKIVQNFSDKKYPFYFAVIVEKLIER